MMAIHRDQRRADVRDVLDEFEKWLLRERSMRDHTAGVYVARVARFADFVEWLPAPVGQSLRKLTAAMVIGLGLRACEIAGLRLDDIGWQTGSLRIRGRGDRFDELPLPDEIGRALEDYALHGRGGRLEGDEVFWTVIRPVQPLSADGDCGSARTGCGTRSRPGCSPPGRPSRRFKGCYGMRI